MDIQLFQDIADAIKSRFGVSSVAPLDFGYAINSEIERVHIGTSTTYQQAFDDIFGATAAAIKLANSVRGDLNAFTKSYIPLDMPNAIRNIPKIIVDAKGGTLNRYISWTRIPEQANYTSISQVSSSGHVLKFSYSEYLTPQPGKYYTNCTVTGFSGNAGMGNPGYQANLSISPSYGNMSDSINLRSAYTYTVSVSDELNAYNNGWLTEEEALSEINNSINNFINNLKNLYYTVTVAYSYGDIY